MVFKLVTAAAKNWRKFDGENQLPKVIQGITFRDGVEVIETPEQNAVGSPPSPEFHHHSFVKQSGQCPVFGLRKGSHTP